MIVVILLGIVSLLVIYLRLVYRYWTKRGVVQEPPLPIVGNFLDVVLIKRNGHRIFLDIYQKYCNSCDAVGVYEFLTPNLLLINPRLIRQVLTNDFSNFHDNEFYVTEDLDPYFYHDPFCLRGEAWKPARTSLASLMTSSKVKDIFPYMKQLLPQLDDFIDQNRSKGLEAKELASLYMKHNVSNSVFGVESNCFTDPNADFRKMGEILIKEQLQSYWTTLLIFFFPRVRDFLRFRVIPKKVSDYLENMLQQVIAFRRKNNIKRNDVIDSIMSKSGDKLFDMVALGVTIFVEAFETSSTVASFLLYELAMNPEIQEKLHEEILNTNDTLDVSYETLINLKYMEQVFKETLRKYGIVYNLKKICTKRCSLNIDGRNVEIDPNTPIIIPLYGVHNDPRYYPDPEVFDPERFPDGNTTAHSDTYYPFGEGPRICPGVRLASAQVKLFIWNILLKFRVLPMENTPLKLTFTKDSLMLVSENPLILDFQRRVD